MGESGCVAWMFEKKGYISIPKSAASEEQIFEIALEAGAADVEDEGEIWGITSDPSDFSKLQEELQKHFAFEEAEIQMLPKSEVQVSGKEAEQVVRLTESLEDLDDVMNVWSNADIIED